VLKTIPDSLRKLQGTIFALIPEPVKSSERFQIQYKGVIFAASTMGS
jgi:hypothetical protein